MAATLLTDMSRATNANGATLEGAKWYFYATGTTTPQAVYANAALSVSLGDTVTADAGGKFVPIYFDAALEYRGVLKDATGAMTIYDIDPINDSSYSKLASDLASTASGKGASLSGYKAPSSSSDRTVYTKLSDYRSPQDDGALSDGSTNDSAAFAAGITAKRNEICASGGYYSIKDVVLSNSQSIIGNDAIFKSAATATNLVKLKDYGAHLSSIYGADTTSCTGAAIVVEDSRACRVTNVTLFNAGYGALKLHAPSGGSCARGFVDSLYAEGVTTNGVELKGAASDWRFSNIFIDGKLIVDGAGLKPTVGSYGWKQDSSPIGALAVGGHQIANGTFIDVDTGAYFKDAQLTKVSNFNIDSCSGYGLIVIGNSFHMDFADLFVGYTAGIYVGDTSVANIDGLRTNGNGLIPSWGGPTWFSVPGPYFDVNVNNTAQLTIANWRGPKAINVASTAKLIVLDGETYQGKTVGTVAVGTTTYLGAQGQSATEADVQWRVPYDCYLIRVMPSCDNAPGAGQSFTYTARYNAADTALVGSISGAGAFGGADVWAGTPIPLAKGGTVSIKLVTSGAAALARHNCIIQIAPR